MFENYNNHDISAYAGFILDNQKLLECTSGGIATALSTKWINQGGYVAGVTYSDDFYKAQYKIINQEDLLYKFKGSKYIYVEKGTIYKDVKSLLDEEKSVLFFGLPCVVAAMRKFLGKDYAKFMAVELICHGPTDSAVHRQYIKYLEKKYNSKVIDFSVRKKDKEWLPAYLYAKFENGKIFQDEFYNTEYGYAFSVMSKPSCYHCQFRGNHRTGDIMIGDFWGATEQDVFWNKKGISAILVHTQKGDSFLKSINDIKLYNTTFEKIVSRNLNVIRPRQLHPNKNKFEKLFAKYDLFYATKHTF